MTRIGFAYNQKPGTDDGSAAPSEEAPRPEEEPPSSSRRGRAGRARSRTGADAIAIDPATDDEFAEWDGPETIAAVERALSALGDVTRLEADADFPERLRAARPDLVFNMAEGWRGVNREAHVPSICEFFGIPYSGSDPFTLSLCLDKARTKEVLAFRGVPTAPFRVVRSLDELGTGNGERGTGARNRNRRASGSRRRSFPQARPLLGGGAASRFPLFVKPLHEGSSKGITERNYCRTPEELEGQVAFLLERYAQPVLIEDYLPGAEFTCAVLGNGDETRVLPIVGMRFDALPSGALPVYGFEAKWLWDRPEEPLEIFECPARIDEALRGAIEEVVLAAYRVLGCRDWSRVDVRLDAAGVPNVVEVNPLPGILPDPSDNSCLPKAARAAGMSYDELIQACVVHAAGRQGVPLPRRAAHDRLLGARVAAALG